MRRYCIRMCFHCCFQLFLWIYCKPKPGGMKKKSKNALFGLVACFLIWSDVISSKKYICYFLNSINGIFLGFLAGGLPETCSIIWPVCQFLFYLFPLNQCLVFWRGNRKVNSNLICKNRREEKMSLMIRCTYSRNVTFYAELLKLVLNLHLLPSTFN